MSASSAVMAGDAPAPSVNTPGSISPVCPTGQNPLSEDLYFLIVHFLSASPCQETASLLKQELVRHGLLRKRADWKGDIHDSSYEDVKFLHSSITPNHLVKLLTQNPVSHRTPSKGLLLGAAKTPPCFPLHSLYHSPATVSLKNSMIKQVHNQHVTGRSPSLATLPTSIYESFDKLKTVYGHFKTVEQVSAPVYCCAFDMSNKLFITGADDRLVKIWSSSTGLLLATLRGHEGEITEIKVSADNKLLATAATDATVRIWDLATGAPVAVLPHRRTVNYVSFGSSFQEDTNFAISVTEDGKICLWPVSEFRKCDGGMNPSLCPIILNHDILDKESNILSLAVNQPGTTFATASMDGSISVWSLKPITATGDRRWGCLRGHTKSIRTLQFSHNGDRLLSGSEDGTARIWQWRKDVQGSNMFSRPVILGQPNGSTGNETVGTAGGYVLGSVSLSVSTARSIVKGPRAVDMIRWNRDDTKVVTAESSIRLRADGRVDTQLRVWNSTTGEMLFLLGENILQSSIYVLDSHPFDPRLVVSAGYDGNVVLWDIDKGVVIKHLVQTTAHHRSNLPLPACDGYFSYDGSMFIISDFFGGATVYGTGAPDRYKYTPTAQFLTTDYAPFVRDLEYRLLDESTQVPPHIIPKSVVLDGDFQPYPIQPHSIQLNQIDTSLSAEEIQMERETAWALQARENEIAMWNESQAKRAMLSFDPLRQLPLQQGVIQAPPKPAMVGRLTQNSQRTGLETVAAEQDRVRGVSRRGRGRGGSNNGRSNQQRRRQEHADDESADEPLSQNNVLVISSSESDFDSSSELSSPSSSSSSSSDDEDFSDGDAFKTRQPRQRRRRRTASSSNHTRTRKRSDVSVDDDDDAEFDSVVNRSSESEDGTDDERNPRIARENKKERRRENARLMRMASRGSSTGRTSGRRRLKRRGDAERGDSIGSRSLDDDGEEGNEARRDRQRQEKEQRRMNRAARRAESKAAPPSEFDEIDQEHLAQFQQQQQQQHGDGGEQAEKQLEDDKSIEHKSTTDVGDSDSKSQIKRESGLGAQKCGLCQQIGDKELEGQIIGPFLLTQSSSQPKRYLFLHSNCALYSPEAEKIDDSRWKQLIKSYRRGMQLVCDVCKKKGANIGCLNSSCPKNFHFGCAVSTGWRYGEDPVYCIQCRHRNQNKSGARGGRKQTKLDPSSIQSSLSASFNIPLFGRGWLQSLTTSAEEYVPQAGDRVVYMMQGHKRYLDRYPQSDPLPWTLYPQLLQETMCTVDDIAYEFPSMDDPHGPDDCLVYARLSLSFALRDAVENGESTKTDNKEISAGRGSVSIRYRPSDIPDYLVLESRLVKSKQKQWKTGERFCIKMDGVYSTGTISGISPADIEYPDSTWEMLEVQWDEQESSGNLPSGIKLKDEDKSSIEESKPMDIDLDPSAVEDVKHVTATAVDDNLQDPKQGQVEDEDEDQLMNRRKAKGKRKAILELDDEEGATPSTAAKGEGSPIDSIRRLSPWEIEEIGQSNAFPSTVAVTPSASSSSSSSSSSASASSYSSSWPLPSTVVTGIPYSSPVGKTRHQSKLLSTLSPVSTMTVNSPYALRTAYMLSPSKTRPIDGLADGLRHMLLTIISTAMNSSEAFLFNAPVDMRQLTDYGFIVPVPMDLSMVKQRLENGYYRQLAAVEFDVKLILKNAVSYNTDDSDIVKDAKALVAGITAKIERETNQKGVRTRSRATLFGEPVAAVPVLPGSKPSNLLDSPGLGSPVKVFPSPVQSKKPKMRIKFNFSPKLELNQSGSTVSTASVSVEENSATGRGPSRKRKGMHTQEQAGLSEVPPTSASSSSLAAPAAEAVADMQPAEKRRRTRQSASHDGEDTERTSRRQKGENEEDDDKEGKEEEVEAEEEEEEAVLPSKVVVIRQRQTRGGVETTKHKDPRTRTRTHKKEEEEGSAEEEESEDEAVEEEEDSDDDFKTGSNGRKSKALMPAAIVTPRLREHRVSNSKQNGVMKGGLSTDRSKRKRSDAGEDGKLSTKTSLRRSKPVNTKKNVIRIRMNGSLNQVIADSSDDDNKEEDSEDIYSSASESDIKLSDIDAESSDDDDSDDEDEDVYTQRSTKSHRKQPLERSTRTVTTRQSPRKPAKPVTQPVQGSKGKKSDQAGTTSRSMRARKPVSMKELDSDLESSDS